MNAGRNGPPLVRCPHCRNAMWWDVTYPYKPTWYCSVCGFPSDRQRSAHAAPPRCPEGCASAVIQTGDDGTRTFVCHRK
ncbi:MULTISPECIES: hypothetical protein [Actinomycetes]|nr:MULTISPECIES: hypothetical protein [Actinomycetes]MCF3102662.1 hypothetical protein [Streptomyces roseoverticillatus]WKU47857.1 hypothetical protein Q3V23_29490 [Streptomyces sp. VNUA116]